MQVSAAVNAFQKEREQPRLEAEPYTAVEVQGLYVSDFATVNAFHQATTSRHPTQTNNPANYRRGLKK